MKYVRVGIPTIVWTEVAILIDDNPVEEALWRIDATNDSQPWVKLEVLEGLEAIVEPGEGPRA